MKPSDSIDVVLDESVSLKRLQAAIVAFNRSIDADLRSQADTLIFCELSQPLLKLRSQRLPLRFRSNL